MTAFDDLSLLRAFVSIVESGNISAAARRLKIPQPSLSRHLRILEERAGASLLKRDTHHMHLTDAGRRFADDARAILGLAEEASERLGEGQVTLRGHLRLFATIDLGQTAVTRLIARFLQANPGVTAELGYTNRPVQMIEAGYDAGVVAGRVTDERVVARPAGTIGRYLVASPELRRSPAPCEGAEPPEIVAVGGALRRAVRRQRQHDDAAFAGASGAAPPHRARFDLGGRVESAPGRAGRSGRLGLARLAGARRRGERPAHPRASEVDRARPAAQRHLLRGAQPARAGAGLHRDRGEPDGRGDASEIGEILRFRLRHGAAASGRVGFPPAVVPTVPSGLSPMLRLFLQPPAKSTAVDAAPLSGGAPLRPTIATLLVCAGYYVGGAIAIELRFQPGGISGIWLPHGILTAALLAAPVRRWWLYAAALLPTHLHLVSTFQGPVPLQTMLIQFGGNIAQAGVAAAVLRRALGQPPRLDSLSRMGAFIVVAAFLAPCLISALVAWLFAATGWVDDFWLAWKRRTYSLMCAAVIIGPAILHLATGGLAANRRAPPRQIVELALLTAVLAAALLAPFAWEPARLHHQWLLFVAAATAGVVGRTFRTRRAGAAPAGRCGRDPAEHEGRPRGVCRRLRRRDSSWRYRRFSWPSPSR